MIDVEHASKTYGHGPTAVHALRDVCLSVAAAETVFLGGPSGSGKSTLLHLIGGLDRPSTGEIRLDGTRLSGLSDRALTAWRAHHVGFVFQNFHLLPVLTALENVEYPLTLTCPTRQLRRDRAVAALEAVGLAGYAQHRPNQLSGGQCQRVAIARALVTRPQLVIADEPTANLDAANGEKVIRLMCGLAAEQGSTLVVCTHNEQLLRAAPRVVRLHDGAVARDMQVAEAATC